jgi:hypothetical protein
MPPWSDGLGVTSIQEVNALPREMAEALYLRLVPPAVLERLEVNPTTLRGRGGGRLVRITAPEEASWARVAVRESPADRDPMLLIDVEMSPTSMPELAFVQVTDPTAPRYDIDRDPDGGDTLFGTISRNLDEERRAMKDGLAPGQVRRGLRMLARVLDAMERFCLLLGHRMYLIEPLFYHSAILYERRGCGYLMGRELMEEIHAGFAEGGPFHQALDCSLPFRSPGAERTVRGRSWAVHDGLPGLRWGGVKMYRATGRPAGVNTFPGAVY